MQNATTCTLSAAFTADRPWRAGCSDKLHAQFGEGWLEKERARATSLASYSTCTSRSAGRGWCSWVTKTRPLTRRDVRPLPNKEKRLQRRQKMYP